MGGMFSSDSDSDSNINIFDPAYRTVDYDNRFSTTKQSNNCQKILSDTKSQLEECKKEYGCDYNWQLIFILKFYY